jgi:glycine/D-amino acid oxidase-like deaminating enzyme
VVREYERDRRMSKLDRLRVGVVGGGVLGLAAAAALARRGAAVTVLTEAEVASGASGRSLAWLNSFGQRSADYHHLRLLGLDRYRALAATDDGSSRHLRFDGGLTWAAPDAGERHRSAYEYMRGIGYDAEWLTPEEVTARVPGVDPDAVSPDGAIFNPQEGWVDLPWLIGSLAREVVRHGGTIDEGAGRCEIVLRGDRVSAVRGGDGTETPVDAALLATGAAVPSTVAGLGVTIPDQSPTALLVRTPPVDTRLRAVLNTPRVALRPAPDGGLVMDAGWSEREVVVGPDGSVHVRDETMAGLLEAACAVLDGHPRLTCASVGVGPKPIPGDGEPVLGPLEGLAGYHVAFTHSGATVGLIAGELLADGILGERMHPLLTPFRPSRFG